MASGSSNYILPVATAVAPGNPLATTGQSEEENWPSHRKRAFDALAESLTQTGRKKKHKK
jgi:hypothetical protein